MDQLRLFHQDISTSTSASRIDIWSLFHAGVKFCFCMIADTTIHSEKVVTKSRCYRACTVSHNLYLLVPSMYQVESTLESQLMIYAASNLAQFDGERNATYHHCLHKFNFESIVATIPTCGLQGQIVHSQRIKISGMCFLHRLHRVMPERVIPLSHDLPRRFEMSSGVRTQPEKWNIPS